MRAMAGAASEVLLEGGAQFVRIFNDGADPFKGRLDLYRRRIQKIQRGVPEKRGNAAEAAFVGAEFARLRRFDPERYPEQGLLGHPAIEKGVRFPDAKFPQREEFPPEPVDQDRGIFDLPRHEMVRGQTRYPLEEGIAPRPAVIDLAPGEGEKKGIGARDPQPRASERVDLPVKFQRLQG